MSLFEDTLVIGSYEGVFFPVIDADTKGGNSGVKHRAYKRRGADCEPTGLTEYDGTMQIALVNGLQSWEQLFPDVYYDLLNRFESTPIGRLQHPTKGAFTAFIENWHEKFSGKGPHNGVILDVNWTEHNGEATVLALADGQSNATNTSHAATIQAGAADAAMASVDTRGAYQPVSIVIDVQITFLDEQIRTYAEITQSVRAMLVPIEFNLALSAFSVASAHSVIVALESLRASVYALRDRYLGDRSRPRTYVVPRDQPLWLIAHEIYGDAGKAQLLATVNSIIDPTLVPAGRRLQAPMV